MRPKPLALKLRTIIERGCKCKTTLRSENGTENIAVTVHHNTLALIGKNPIDIFKQEKNLHQIHNHELCWCTYPLVSPVYENVEVLEFCYLSNHSRWSVYSGSA